MAAAHQHPAPDSIAFEIDAKVVRAEVIRAIRGFVTRPDYRSGNLPRRPKPTSFYAVIRIMRELELTLTAISGSLAEGVEHVAGTKPPPP